MSDAAKCEKCSATTVQHCDENNCGYLGAGNGAPEPMPASVPGSFNDLAALVPERNPTPGHHWKGDEDPHKGRYDCTRDDLTLGEITDDELANYAFLKYDQPLDIVAIMTQDPGYHAPIVIMTAVKDRIRWLTRQLDKLQADNRRIAACGEDLLGQLINATEGFDEPISDEEISEYKATLGIAGEDD